MMARFAALFLLLVVFATAAVALEPDRREAIVVSARVWDGYQYKETFVPSNRDEILLLSGQDSALSFVRTQEYYWPLSRQVYVDFERQRDEVPGVLRIERDGALAAEVLQQPFSILYPEGAINGNGRLLWGAEALDAFARHQQDERAFARDLVAAQRASTEYEHRLLESGAARVQGAKAEVIQPPPPLPEPSLRLVTQPAPGYRIALDPGLYRLSLVQDGKPVPGTVRQLRVIDAEGRAAVVADIVPEERWTRPLASNSPVARVFVRPDATFYLTLADATRFEEAEYLPVVAPQAEAAPGRTMWVRRKPSDLDRLTLRWTGMPGSEELSLQQLKVEQTDGSGFGYRVRTVRGAEGADLTAFPVMAPSGTMARRGWITGADGSFAREVVVVPPRRAGLSLFIGLIPLLAFAVFAARRFQR
jgi:hypothetical protein